MTARQTDATTDPQSIVAALQQRLDAALAREAALTQELAARTTDLAERKTEFDERIEQQSAIIDVLRAMSASPGDTQPVFDVIVRRAVDLCNAQSGGIFEYDGERVHIGTIHGLYEHNGELLSVHSLHGTEAETAPASLAAYLRQFPMPPKRGSVSMRAILDCQILHIRDMREEVDLLDDVRRLSHRSQVSIPLIRDARAIGVITMAAHKPGGFSDSQIQLLKTFAEQAVIAVGSAETFRKLNQRTADLQESLEFQTATSDVLKVISRSTFDLQPVLDTLVETAAHLCEADLGHLAIPYGDTYRSVASFALSPELESFVRGLTFARDTGSVVGRAVVLRRVVHVEDIHADPEHVLAATPAAQPFRTTLGVPLFRAGEPIGVIALMRQRVETFTDRQIELVSTFADQAVIAIENTRLLTEQREALEQQTAAAEVLQVINASPGNLEPVFATILEKAILLCDSSFGGLSTYDGEFFHVGATRGMSPGLAKALRERGPLQPNKSFAYDQIVRGADIVHIPDITAPGRPFPSSPNIDQDGARTTLFVALRGDDALFGVLVIFRKEVRLFSDRQIALLKNFAAQAVIAMENARLINETREALEQQTATAEVLQVINTSPGDLEPVFEAILEKAHSLCDIALGSLELYDGERFRAVAFRGLSGAFADMLRRGYPASDNPATRPLIEGDRFSHIRDLAETDYSITRSSVELTGARTLLCVPLRRDDALLGMIASGRREARPFSEKEIALLENFAAQAVIAMENARLITEQQEALEQQTATAEVLQVINASPGNLAPVFDAMLDKAIHLCDATYGHFRTYDGDGFALAAVCGDPSLVELHRQRMHYFVPGPHNPISRLRRGERLIHIGDAAASEAYRDDPGWRELVDTGACRSVLAVALRKDTVLLGYISVYRQEVRAFSDKQIALLENFAAQAVIAMENARLIDEQREALEQQTATAEVLQVINASPGNLTPVFDAMLEKAMRLCGAACGGLFTYDGERFHTMATLGVPVAAAEFRTKNPPTAQPGSGIARLLRTRRTDQILDRTAEEDYRSLEPGARAMVELGGARTMLNVPLLKEDEVVGFFSVYRQEVRAFSAKQIALLENFAAQAVIAMENARLLDEIRQRQEELRITFENMGDGVAMFDETQHLVAWNRKFQDILDVPDDIIERRQTFSEYVRYLAERGEYGPEADAEKQIRRLIEQAGQARTDERTRPDGRVIEIRHNPVAGGGFVLIYADITERKRSEAEIRAARDAAEQANRTIEAAFRELKVAQANLIQAEKMASLGQLTAGIAHEIKNPLNFVNNFAALSVDLLGELKETAAPGFAALTDDQRAEIDDVSAMLTSNLEKITEHGKRADSIVKAMLEHSRGSSGERRMVDLNAVIDEALKLAYHGARAQDQSFNITLERDFGEGIAPIEVNPQDITRVFLNILSNGFYAATKRARSGAGAGFAPTLKVTTRDAGEAMEIRVRDNGTGIPPDIRDKLFQPFFTTKPTGEGTGLGLSITYDIVTQQHGGSIAVDSKVGEYSEFTIRLPRNP